MKIVLTIVLCFLSLQIFAQNLSAQNLEKRFTHSAENGYSWLEYAKTSHTTEDYRYNYLASMLDYHRGRKIIGLKPRVPIDCFDEMQSLSERGMSEELDLHAMVELVNKFYSAEENLIIPILGAYCYSIKSLTGISVTELEEYRMELLDFSLDKSEE